MRNAKTENFKTADGTKVPITVVQLGAIDGGKLLIRLGKSIGPALAGVAVGVQGGKLDTVPAAVRELFATLTEDEFEHVLTRLLRDSVVALGGQQMPVLAQIDTLFQGQVSELYRLLWFAVGVNYGNFFDAIGGLDKIIAMGKAKITSVPNVPSASGSSGQPNV